jgi:hypothetical protein
MNTKNLASLAVAAVVLAACASADLSEGTPQPEKQYRTGSNIPRRAGSRPDSVQSTTMSPADNTAAPMPRPSATGR